MTSIYSPVAHLSALDAPKQDFTNCCPCENPEGLGAFIQFLITSALVDLSELKGLHPQGAVPDQLLAEYPPFLEVALNVYPDISLKLGHLNAYARVPVTALPSAVNK